MSFFVPHSASDLVSVDRDINNNQTEMPASKALCVTTEIKISCTLVTP